MNVKLQRWGNSQGIRLPKAILNELGLVENDTIEITTSNNSIILTKKKKHRNLKERVESFYQLPLDEIKLDQTEEISTSPMGDEIW